MIIGRKLQLRVASKAQVTGLVIIGTLDNLFVEDGAKFVDAEILNSSDLTGVPVDMRLIGNDVVTDEQGRVQADSTAADADTEPGEDEVEESTMHADEQTRSQPTGTIELEEREEDQRLGGARCLCCNAHMDNDQYAVCMDCGGGV